MLVNGIFPAEISEKFVVKIPGLLLYSDDHAGGVKTFIALLELDGAFGDAVGSQLDELGQLLR
jgi:hypothetical protein